MPDAEGELLHNMYVPLKVMRAAKGRKGAVAAQNTMREMHFL